MRVSGRFLIGVFLLIGFNKGTAALKLRGKDAPGELAQCDAGTYVSGDECLACEGSNKDNCHLSFGVVTCTSATDAVCSWCKEGFYRTSDGNCRACTDTGALAAANIPNCVAVTCPGGTGGPICATNGCADGFQWDPSTATCKARNCKTYVTNGRGVCDVCNDKWYAANGKCEACAIPTGCSTARAYKCTSGSAETTQCTGCQKDFFKDPAGTGFGTCRACALAHCLKPTCIGSNVPPSCAAADCEPGYAAAPASFGTSYNVCKATNCQSWAADGACTACAAGYAVNAANGTCAVSCSETDPASIAATSVVNCNRVTCGGATQVCSGCVDGYTYDAASRTCRATNCKTLTADGRCTACNDGWFADNGKCSACTLPEGCVATFRNAVAYRCTAAGADNAQCSNCKAGFAKDPAGSGANLWGVCRACSVPRCARANCIGGVSPPNCVQCNEGFTPWASSFGWQHQVCRANNCQTLAADGSCTTCAPGFALNAATGACAACPAGTFANGSAGCTACSLPNGCSAASTYTCTSATDSTGTCTACQAGYFLDGTGRCKECALDKCSAATCAGGTAQPTCPGCDTGFAAEPNGACKATNCKTYAADGLTCAQCNDSWYKVDGVCLACTHPGGACITLRVGSYTCTSPTNTMCKSCSPGFFKTTSVGTCNACAMANCPAPTCLGFSASPTCTQCDAGFAPGFDSRFPNVPYTVCRATNCQSFSANGNLCASCPAGFGFDSAKGTCTACADGTTSGGGTAACA